MADIALECRLEHLAAETRVPSGNREHLKFIRNYKKKFFNIKMEEKWKKESSIFCDLNEFISKMFWFLKDNQKGAKGSKIIPLWTNLNRKMKTTWRSPREFTTNTNGSHSEISCNAVQGTNEKKAAEMNKQVIFYEWESEREHVWWQRIR